MAAAEAWPAAFQAGRLSGRIVAVEPLHAGHEEGLFAAGQDTDWTYMPVAAAASRAAFAAWTAAALAESAAGREAGYAICDATSGEPLGSTRFLEPRPEHSSLEIGWTWLRRSTWRSGANVEAKLLLLTYAFQTLHCERVELKSDALNERSRTAMAALPAQFEGIHRRHRRRADGSWRDTSWYSVIAPEWPAVRANLQRRLQRVRGE